MAKKDNLLTAIEKLMRGLSSPRPMNYQDITEKLITQGYWVSESKNPGNTVNARLTTDINNKGSMSKFMRTGRGMFALREWISHYPEYAPKVDSGILQLKQVTLTNFRSFESLELNIDPNFTVVVGDNGAGKTSILDAIAILLGAFVVAIKSDETPIRIVADDAQRIFLKTDTKAGYKTRYPVVVHCFANFDNQIVEWARRKKDETASSELTQVVDFSDFAKLLRKQVVELEQDTLLPVIAYYSTGRLWRLGTHNLYGSEKIESRLKGYDKCLEPASHIEMLMDWFSNQEAISLQKGTRPSFLAVKEAIKTSIRYAKDIFYDFSEKDIVVTFQNDQNLPFRMLSEGIKNMLAMVADIAYRAAVLNPSLKNPVKESPGVVLIDEVDLHLHPKWQQRVVGDLQSTFPNIQFIVTTHSPFVVAAAPSIKKLNLSSKENPVDEFENEYRNLPIDEILTSQIFEGTIPFNEEISMLFNKRLQALSQGKDVSAIEDKLRKLNSNYFGYLDIDNLIATMRKRSEEK